jgi:hypothetical protein
LARLSYQGLLDDMTHAYNHFHCISKCSIQEPQNTKLALKTKEHTCWSSVESMLPAQKRVTLIRTYKI